MGDYGPLFVAPAVVCGGTSIPWLPLPPTPELPPENPKNMFMAPFPWMFMAPCLHFCMAPPPPKHFMKNKGTFLSPAFKVGESGVIFT